MGEKWGGEGKGKTRRSGRPPSRETEGKLEGKRKMIVSHVRSCGLEENKREKEKENRVPASSSVPLFRHRAPKEGGKVRKKKERGGRRLRALRRFFIFTTPAIRIGAKNVKDCRKKKRKKGREGRGIENRHLWACISSLLQLPPIIMDGGSRGEKRKRKKRRASRLARLIIFYFPSLNSCTSSSRS